MNPQAERRRLPLFSKIIYILSVFSLCLFITFALSEPFANLFNSTVGALLRFLLATVTAWIPFSVAELCIILIPFAIVALIVLAWRRYCDSWRNTFVFIATVFSCAALVLNLFVWTFAAAYRTSPLDEQLGLQRQAVSAEELSDTAEILADELMAVLKEITFLPSGESVMPYSHNEMNQRLNLAFSSLCEKYDFLDHFPTLVKPVMLSEPMSYTHITGVYTFFTGEANINVNFPDYTIPHTAAHEMAHQRGIAREDEANFIAFLVCMESNDPYIRYSGLLSTYEFVMSALASADYALYVERWYEMADEVHDEQAAYSAFFEKYRDNLAADVSDATNDAYLKGQGAAAGTQSYGMVVDLAVAYFKQ